MRKVSLVLFGAAIGAASVAVGTQTHVLDRANAAASDTYRSLNLFGDVFEKIRTDYVEKPDDQKLVESAINGMLTSLDPHSSYMDAKGFREMTVQTHGEFGGLGIEVSARTTGRSRSSPRSTTRRRRRPASSRATSSTRSTAIRSPA